MCGRGSRHSLQVSRREVGEARSGVPEPFDAHAIELSGNACPLPRLPEGVPTDRSSPFAVEDQAIPAWVVLITERRESKQVPCWRRDQQVWEINDPC